MNAVAEKVNSNRRPEDAAADYLAAKKLLAEAQKMVSEAGDELIAMLGKRDEGSKTHAINGFKVTIKGVVNRKADLDLMKTILAELRREDPDFPSPIKTKEELDETGVKWLRDNMPSEYQRLAKAITATPGKTGIEVVRTE